MSIASEITRLQGVKSDILQAISDKGVEVPIGSALADCPELIGQIEHGGGGAYILEEVPNDDFGADGEYAIVLQKMIAGDNGTIIPIQSDNTNCFCSPNTADAYKAFDGSDSSYIDWRASHSYSSAIPGFVGYDFGENDKKKIVSVSILNKTLYGNYLGIVIIQASNDKGNWFDLACGKMPDTASNAWYTFTFTNENYYRYYRVLLLSSHNTGYGLNASFYELHMNDAALINSGEKQPIAFRKRCGQWVPLDSFDIIKPYSDRVKAIYVPNGTSYGENIRYPSMVSQVPYTTDCRFEAVWDMDSSLTLPYNNNSQQYSILGLNSYYTSNPLVSVLLGLTGYDSGTGTYNQVTITAATRGGYFSYTMAIADFRNLKQLKVVIQGANVSMYFDDTLVTGTITGYITNTYTDTFNYILGQNSNALSAQLGLKEFKCNDNNDGHLIFDFVPAQDTITGNLGFVEKVSKTFLGISSVPQIFP